MLSVRDAVKAKWDIVTAMGQTVSKGSYGTVLWISDGGDICKVQFYALDGKMLGGPIDTQVTNVCLIYDNDAGEEKK